MRVLIAYASTDWPLRSSVRDHIYCFDSADDLEAVYVNFGIRRAPKAARSLSYDLVVFHTSFLSLRWNEAKFEAALRRFAGIDVSDAPRVAIPQDEFLNSELLTDALVHLGVDHVFTCAPESEWGVIYPRLIERGVTFSRVLTGYLADDAVERINRIVQRNNPRQIDIGYRAKRVEAWLGRHGWLKARVADAVKELARPLDLALDISTDQSETLLGDEWYEFLARCRYTIGVEGGASILDADGSLVTASRKYVASHPHADYEEVEAACFPGRDGELRLFALSPRHLEACATRTTQILIEGEYNGLLQPDVHYIPVRRDLSNLGEVLAGLDDEARRERIARQAYEDVVASGLVDYRRLTYMVLAHAAPRTDPARPDVIARLRHSDRLTWRWVAVRARARDLLRAGIAHLTALRRLTGARS